VGSALRPSRASLLRQDLEGRSRGKIVIVNWTARHPQRVATAVYGDDPNSRGADHPALDNTSPAPVSSTDGLAHLGLAPPDA
jgi:hypothetical protein